MKNKKCTRCGKRCIITRFNLDRTTKDGHAYECKFCATARTKRWKRKGTPKERAVKKQKIRLSHKLSRKRNRHFVFTYLQSHPCVDCGESDPIVLEFDHVRGNKSMNVSFMMNGNYSIEKLSLEIAKCEVRCANCHRRRTSLDQGWYKDLLV